MELREITKRYPGVLALDGVSIGFEAGEVHAVVGENGAGKSTLMKVMAGAIRPDAGELWFEGTRYEHMSPQLAHRLGIEIVYQEFNLLPSLTVAENLFVGELKGHALWIDRRGMEEEAGRLFETMGVKIDPRARVRELSVASMQLVEIAKSLRRGARVLIMDEPTSGLDPLIQQAFYDILKEENSRGATVFFSSHVLSEVQKLCDRVAILKEGQLIGIQSIKELRESGYKKVSLSAKEAIPRDFFDLSGIANYAETADKTSVSFMYNGNITAIIDKLHLLHLDDVLLEEPSLEEIFMHYYA